MTTHAVPVRSLVTGFLLAFLLVSAGSVFAAPHHGDPFVLQQPDGSPVEVLVWGDEFYQRIENLEGYTLVRDDETQVICYARLDATGTTFESTGVPVGEPVPGGLVRGLKIPPASRSSLASQARETLFVEEAAILSQKDRDPEPSNQGNVRGITLIIDFSDQVGTVPAEDFDAYLNQEGYTGYSNNGSVRDYFYDVSGGALTYTNYVPAVYLRAPQPKTYYEDPNISYGQRARQLVIWALNELDDQGLDFSQYDANGDGFIDAINVFYAGQPTGGWAVGLWPHSSVVSFYADGISSYKYQITNIGSTLRLSTFCHENGHMIMFWPDLYDYGYESSGVGGFCLMCNSGAGTNPVRPCAYLRAEAGWEDPVILEGMHSGLVASHADLSIYKVPRTGHANEFYLVENRYRTGRDSSIPDSGLAVWHVDTYGSNNNEQQTPGSHYLVTLVQADGRWDLEHGNGSGDSTDLWKAPTYVEFNPSTIPPATWWDGSDAPVYLDGIGYSGNEMTFNYRESLGTMGVTITPLPEGMEAPWTLTGPEDYLFEGVGERMLLVWNEGTYTLTWGDVPGWSEPDPVSESFEIVDGGAPAVFIGTYSNPPFALAPEGAAADPGLATAVTLLDFDGDGDMDIHVVNDGSADKLLRNDGGFAYTDITPASLAITGAGRSAAWGDYDNDGDADVYLVRDGEANILLSRDGEDFVDVTAQNYGLGDEDAGQFAVWGDLTNSGNLDLYLVQNGSANMMFKNYGDMGSGYPLLIDNPAGPLNNAGPGTRAPWCDFDLDGDLDFYLVNNGSENVLIRSYDGTAFEDAAISVLASPNAGRDAVWADFDNDHDWDLFLVNEDQADAYFQQDQGYFQQMFEPVVQDDGPGRAVALADFDNDGFQDLYVVRYGMEDLVLFGDGNGGFQRAPLALAGTDGSCLAVACGDLDGDGGQDVYIGRGDQPNLVLQNAIADRGHWLQVALVGDTANRDALGARVRVVAGSQSQLREMHGDGVHFGLGSASIADSVIVSWPGGDQTIRTDVPIDRRMTIAENQGTTGVPGSELPLATGVSEVFPNPFNPSTTIAFDLARSGAVELSIYGLDGRRVAVLVQDNLQAGSHQATWRGQDNDGRAMASGTYFCRLRTQDEVSTRRLTLVK